MGTCWPGSLTIFRRGKGCYRSARLFGGDVTFVLSAADTSLDRQPAGNPKAATGSRAPPVSRSLAGRRGAGEGVVVPDFLAWLDRRSGPDRQHRKPGRPGPSRVGNRPGKYVLERELGESRCPRGGPSRDPRLHVVVRHGGPGPDPVAC